MSCPSPSARKLAWLLVAMLAGCGSGGDLPSAPKAGSVTSTGASTIPTKGAGPKGEAVRTVTPVPAR